MNRQKFLISLASISLIIFLNQISGQSKLVCITDLDSTIKTDVKYATTDNFTGQILYQSNKVYLIQEVAEALIKVNNYLKKNYNLQIKIFDGYRPLSVQKKMWEVYPDETYVANPIKGSRHNRGCAVDLTLIDLDGNELDMGTSYDDFTPKAHINYKNLPKNVLRNRQILIETMKKFGFIPNKSEWWHFDYKDWKKYPILDIPIN